MTAGINPTHLNITVVDFSSYLEMLCSAITEERVIRCRDSVVTLSRLHLKQVGLSAGHYVSHAQ